MKEEGRAAAESRLPDSGQRRTRIVGAVLAVAAVAFNLAVLGRATVMLDVGLAAAYFAWRAWPPSPSGAGATVRPIYLAAVAVQGLHFVEEYLTGFAREFPRLFGYVWSDLEFAVFNLIWLAIFLLAAVGLLRRWDVAGMVVWFFALAGGIGNGLGHLAWCLARGRYMPGAWTAPLCLAMGIWLVRRLVRSGPGG